MSPTSVAADFTSFLAARRAWSHSTFGPPSRRGPIGPLKHLAKEITEVIAAPEDIEEYADLVFLVFDAIDRAGFSYPQLLDACWKKLEKNKARVWPASSADEPVEHVREHPEERSIPALEERARAAEAALDELRTRLREMIDRLR